MHDNGRHRGYTDPLFDGQTNVVPVGLIDYLEWLANPHHQRHGLFALPPIQRRPLWKPAQIVNLWDSLLRGMPFGSFLVTRIQAKQDHRPIEITSFGQRGVSTVSQTKAQFFLLDGQQRTLALRLGYCRHPHARLWLDLGQAGTQGRVFSLRLTTTSQPFGFDPNDPSHKLSAAQKRDAHRAFVEIHTQHKGKYDYELPLADTRPWNAELPVPLDELWQAWRECAKSRQDNIWWKPVVGPHCDPKEAHAQIDQAIIDLLLRAFERLDGCRIPFILVPGDVLEASTGHQQEEDIIETLYTRIGTGGTALSGEEHIFSLLKHRWPRAHDVVDNLQSAQFLKPTEIVMTAVRLVRAMQQEEDMPKPRVKDFRRWLTVTGRAANHASAGDHQQTGEAQKPFFEALQGFVGESSRRTSRLQDAFACFRRLIDYRKSLAPGAPLDPGMPKVFLPHIQLPAIQVVLRWIDLQHRRDDTFFEANRGEVLRFLFFWHTAVYSEDNASKCAFGQVKGREDFPGRVIYDSLTTGTPSGERVACRLPTPQTLRAALGQPTNRLRTWNERFRPEEPQDDERAAAAFLQRWWWQKDMLLWLQRQWVESWFTGYNPLDGQDEDTPYDYDHILPRVHLLHADWSQFATQSAREHPDLYNRNVLCNAIGNYRVWPSALNRGDGAESPKTKLYLATKLAVLPADDWPDTLKTPGDVFAASAMDTADLPLWISASGDDHSPKQWREARVKAFQTAVEQRVAWLYERFYRELDFAAWEG